MTHKPRNQQQYQDYPQSYYPPYPPYPQQRRRPTARTTRKANTMSHAKHCPYCGEEIPAYMLNSGNHKKPAERLFRITPSMGWIIFFFIVVAIAASALPK